MNAPQQKSELAYLQFQRKARRECGLDYTSKLDKKELRKRIAKYTEMIHEYERSIKP
jgi:hypothetical protein